jgi:ABC-2 type transport system ATP-binding protein
LLHGMAPREAEQRSGELLEIMMLTDSADTKTSRFSGGMRRRADLIQALVHSPPILFLDEPTTGMDPQSRIALWGYLEKLKSEGTTILLTTQYLEEADRACDRIAIIDEGKLLKTGSPAVLKDELGTDRITLELTSELTEDTYARAARSLGKHPEVRQIEQVEPLVLSVSRAGASLPHIMRQLEADGLQITSIATTAVTLDDVFLRYTGHKVQSKVESGPSLSAAFAAVHGRPMA